MLKSDPRNKGRGGTGEVMVGATVEGVAGTTGSEHLSSLREGHLRLLAGDTGLAYHRLTAGEPFIAALTDPALARPVQARLALGPALAGLALLLLVWRQLPRRPP